MIIDPHCAKLKGFAGAHGFVDIFCPDGRCETIHDVVGFLQDFFLGVEATNNDDRGCAMTRAKQ